jgi:hypothetical protein
LQSGQNLSSFILHKEIWHLLIFIKKVKEGIIQHQKRIYEIVLRFL